MSLEEALYNLKRKTCAHLLSCLIELDMNKSITEIKKEQLYQ